MSVINKVQEKYNAMAVFPYGSSVYKNKKPEDLDLIIVTNKDYFQEKLKYDDLIIEVSNFSKGEFLQKRHEHDIAIMECLFIQHPDCFVDPSFAQVLNAINISPNKLRNSVSQKSSNSYVKAKKKLLVEEDLDINRSLKSLWHSIRMIDFATQLVKHGCITDEKSCNHYFDQIQKDYLIHGRNWEKIHEKYKPIQNEFMKELRKHCPKLTNGNKYN